MPVAKGVNRDLPSAPTPPGFWAWTPNWCCTGRQIHSVKTVFTDRDGSRCRCCVRQLGWDAGHDRAAGPAAVRLKPLCDMVAFDELSDDDMVMLQRRLLMDLNAPNPSVEAILHGLCRSPYRPQPTPTPSSVADQPQPHGEDLVRDLPDSIVVP